MAIVRTERIDSTQLLTSATVLFVGGGAIATSKFLRNHLSLKSFLLIDSDPDTLIDEKKSVIFKMGNSSCRGNLVLGHGLAHQHKAELLKALNDFDVIFLVIALGGGISSGASPEIARFIYESGKRLRCVVSLPYSFEGEQRKLASSSALEKLNRVSNTCEVLKLDWILPWLSKDAKGVDDAFDLSDKFLSWKLLGILPDLYDDHS
jgi:cell division protein FtsZ